MCEELEMVNYLIKFALFCLPTRFLFGVLRIGFLEAPKILIFLDQVGDMFACKYCWIARRSFFALATGDTMNFSVVVGVKKEWYGITLVV